MNPRTEYPRFDDEFPFLNQFILELAGEHKAGKINSWDDLDERVKAFYTPNRMDAIEAKAPGWKKMASYSGGITLTHVTCVFLGMFMLSEYQSLSSEKQQLAKWIVLLHDIDKFHLKGKKDTLHPFKSAVIAAKVLPGNGFPTSEEYSSLIRGWADQTTGAFIPRLLAPQKPDNKKLPEIISGIDLLFGKDNPAALITKAVLLHTSLDVDKNYPTPAPLKDDEIRFLISPDLLPLLKVMMLSDNEGWSLFDQKVREQQRRDTLKAFEWFEELIRT